MESLSEELKREIRYEPIDYSSSQHADTGSFHCCMEVLDLFDPISDKSSTSFHPSIGARRVASKRSVDENDDVNASHPSFWGNNYSSTETILQMQKNMRRFNFDFFETGLIFCSGSVVNDLVLSDVSHYLDFQNLDGLFYPSSDAKQKLSILPVPCSKGDVFQSTLLTMIEKRCMMKFIQSVADWGRMFEEGQDLNSLNEIELAQGRSLHRPQNKEALATQVDFSGYYDQPFVTFLKTFSLSTKLQEMIIYALCIESNAQDAAKLTALDGLKSLYRHLSSLGRFGDSAFLYPCYGFAEIPQAFCRMSAVWGGVYMLRRGVCKVDVLEEYSKKNPEHRLLRVTDTMGRTFTCDSLVCNTNYWKMNDSDIRGYMVSSIIIASGPAFEKSKCLCVFPPKTSSLNNNHPIFVIQLDDSSHVVPTGFYYVMIVTEMEKEANKDSCLELIRSVSQMLSTIAPSFVPQYSVTVRSPLWNMKEISKSLPPNILLCGSEKVDLSFQQQFHQARQFFESICKNKTFLDKFMKPERGNEDDVDVEEERDFNMLASALSSLQQGSSENSPVSMDGPSTTQDMSSNQDYSSCEADIDKEI